MAETAQAKAAPPKENTLARLLKTNPPAAAGILFALFVVPPLAILVLSAEDGWNDWCTASALLMGAAVVPSLATFLRLSWANPVGQYLCWAELIQVAARIVSSGFRPVLALPAGVAIVALLTLTSAQAGPAATAKERAPDSLALWVRENIEAIIVAFIMALVIRCFCIEVFKIPSSSMEPTLMGDNASDHQGCQFSDHHRDDQGRENRGGDRIMVTKYYYAFTPIERYDVVVFKFPLNQAKNFIKRVVGLPDEDFKIYHGNVFTKRDGEASFTIARRTLRTQDSIWIPLHGHLDYLSGEQAFRTKWTESPADGPRAGFGIARRELATLEKAGSRGIRFQCGFDRHQHGAGEAQVAFDFELTSAHGSLFAQIANDYGRFEAELSTDGESVLRFNEPGSEGKPATERVALTGVRLTTDRKYRLALSVFDGIAYVRLNDEVVGKHPFITTRESVKFHESSEHWAAFGSRDVTFKVRNLAVGRDIHYSGKENLPNDEARRVGPGCYIMMGDNVDNSHDARSWTEKSYRLEGRNDLVVFEEQEGRWDSDKAQQLKDRYGLDRLPDKVIKADRYGNEWALFDPGYAGDLKGRRFAGVISGAPEEAPFYAVDRKFIVGKALWVWWPQGRWFRLIR